MLDLRAANNHRFRLAKRLWMLSNVLKLTIFLIGAWVVFRPPSTQFIPLYLMIIGVVSEFFQLWSDKVKDDSESLLRHLDMCRSFDVEISPADKRSIADKLPKRLRKKFNVEKEVDEYFASQEKPGARRAVENLVESAWYTKKQSWVMVGICFALIVAALTFSVIALIITSQKMNEVTGRAGVYNVVTSWILLLFGNRSAITG